MEEEHGEAHRRSLADEQQSARTGDQPRLGIAQGPRERQLLVYIRVAEEQRARQRTGSAADRQGEQRPA